MPPLRARVTDLTGTLTPDSVRARAEAARRSRRSKGSQIAVLIVPTTQPEDDRAVFRSGSPRAWKLGRRGVDDGVLLLVAKDDRAVRIEVGYGLEGALPDVHRPIASSSEVIVPRFRSGDFYGGADARRRRA